MFFDYHIHIGQFQEIYFSPRDVVKSLISNNVKGGYISCTTSCMEWNNIDDKNIIIEHIKAEFQELKQISQKYNFDARALCWIIPQRYYEGESVDQMLFEADYQGVKIHPRAHKWNFDDCKTVNLMNDLCNCANERQMPIFIHTGICDFESPKIFEHWFKKHPEVTFILCHCKDEQTAVEMFRKYDNIYGDISFAPTETFELFCELGFSNRILYGTDFPITMLYNNSKKHSLRSLKNNYKELLSIWRENINKFGEL